MSPNGAPHDVAYWRGIVAAGAEIETGHITQFSPKGLAEHVIAGLYWIVKLGPLVLTHEGNWVFRTKDEPLAVRLAYVHRTLHEALTALRRGMAPDEPACAEILEAIYGKKACPNRGEG